jgi:hypothetical protein
MYHRRRGSDKGAPALYLCGPDTRRLAPPSGASVRRAPRQTDLAHLAGFTRAAALPLREGRACPTLPNLVKVLKALGQLNDQAQGIVDCLFIWEGPRHVRIEPDQVRPGSIAFGVLASYTFLEKLPEIVLGAQFVFQF